MGNLVRSELCKAVPRLCMAVLGLCLRLCMAVLWGLCMAVLEAVQGCAGLCNVHW